MKLVLFAVVFLTACDEHSVEEYADATSQCAKINMIVIDSHRGKLCCSSPQSYSCSAYPNTLDKSK